MITYSATFPTFAGVMVWDASQAYANSGFIPGVYSDLKSLKKRAVEADVGAADVVAVTVDALAVN